MPQTDLFGEKVKEKAINKIEDHWLNMPECNNVNRQKPEFIAMVRFRNKEDFTEFSKLARDKIFKGILHWGSLKKNVRVTWYPPFDGMKDYVYVDDDDDLIEELFDYEE